MATQRLILLFDGTWNDPEDQTNVYRLSRTIKDFDGETRQRFFYDPGVGTTRWSKYRGGLFGFGLSENLLQGYDWLARNFRETDQIWIFGFSRGAYTARSLVGLIRKCGLLHISTPVLLKEAERIYRDKNLHPDSRECEEFRRLFSREVSIYFIGVWDTIGALGVPGTFLSEKGKYAWHDTRLSKIVKHAYHAIALDEHREAYNVALWTNPENAAEIKQIDVEQRWFIGAHANVGGGYGEDPLADISLSWMQRKAEKHGLKLNMISPKEHAWKATPTPSYDNFMKGFYAFVRRVKSRGDGKFHRAYSVGDRGLPAVNIVIDESVWNRWKDDTLNYRPPTLVNARVTPPEA